MSSRPERLLHVISTGALAEWRDPIRGGIIMHNLLILFDTPSLLVSSVTEQLKNMGDNPTSCNLQVKDISAVKDKPELYLIFADDDISDNVEALVYLKDKSIENDIPFMVVGDDRELENLEKIIPESLIKKKFTRPVNVKNVAEVVDAYLKDEKRISKKKILVVDDSGAMLRNIKGWLEDKYQIVLANSGAMAIKYLTLDRPDLVLLDYEMPVVDGRQVLEMIRTETEFSDVPVIFLTAKSDKQSVIDVMALKPEGYLLKTMPPADIIAAVDDFFAKRKFKMQ